MNPNQQSHEEIFLREFYKLPPHKQDVNKTKEFLLLTEYKKSLGNINTNTNDPDLQTKFENQKATITNLYNENEANKKLVADLTQEKYELNGNINTLQEKQKELEAKIVELTNPPA